MSDLRTPLGGVELPNPVMTAAGCAASGREPARFFDVGRLGAVVTASVMPRARAGGPTPRVVETPSGLLNSVGLPGPGVEVLLREDLPWLTSRGVRVIVSIAGHTVAEYAEVARGLDEASGVSAVEVNLGCPNAAEQGVMFASRPETVVDVVRAVRAHLRADVPVFAKLSSDVADIVGVAMACVDAGADGLSMINTVLGMAIDTAAARPALAGAMGGLSGPAVRPVAVRCVYQVHAALPEVPIIGMGGVRTGRDAVELIMAGASAVAVGTAIFHDPSVCVRVVRELDNALDGLGIGRLADAVGLAHRPQGPRVRRIAPPVVTGGGPEHDQEAAP